MAWYSGLWPFSKSAASNSEASGETAIVKAGPESFTTTATVPGPTKPAGADGTAVIGGYIVSGERSPSLVGRSKWTTFDNATLNVAIVSAALNVWTQLAGSAKWTAEPNRRGGAKAKKAADILTEGLLEAQMSIPWRAVVRRQVVKKFRGFALHEMIIRRRSDGVVVCADLGDRPQWTINRWDVPDSQTPWQGVEQLDQFGKTFYIPRERLFYSVENTLSPTPEGVGLLRMLAEHVRVLELYQQWEGIGYQTDLRGVPVAKAPLAALRKLIDPGGVKSESEVRSGIQNATKFLTDFLMAHNKRADQGVMLDSATFPDVQGNPTGTAQWAFELIQGSGGSMAEVGQAIGRITREIARVMQAEWLMLGGEDSGGAYSMHEDKTAMFGLIVNSALDDIADDATRDCATRLTALNGLDPETCTPKLVPEPVATSAVQAACQSLATLATAGLQPNDPAINILRGRLNLPPAPEIDESQWMLQRQGMPPEINTEEPPPDDGPGDEQPPDEGEGEAGNVNARPDAQDDVAKYSPEQPREPDGRWGAGGGGASMSGGVRPWTLAFDDRDHQRVIDQHRRTEADSRKKATAAKQKISELKRSGGSPAAIRRLTEQVQQHRAAAEAARNAKQAAQAHLKAAMEEHTATRRAAAAERNDAAWERARQEADSTMAIGQHRIGGSEGHPDVAPTAHDTTPIRHVSEADTAAAMERASADLQRRSDALRARDERQALNERLGVGKPVQEYRQVVHHADKIPTADQAHAEEAARRQREHESDARARARNEALRPKVEHQEPLPEAHTHRPGLLGRLRSLVGRKRYLPEIPEGIPAEQIAKLYADALEDQRLDDEALLDELEAEVAKYDENQDRSPNGRWSGGGSAEETARIDRARRETAETARVQGRDPQAAGVAAADAERTAIANENAARSAGHLLEVPHAALDNYPAARDASRKAVGNIRAKLDAHHAAVAQVLADLHAHDGENQLEHTRALAADHFESTSQHLGALAGQDDEPDFARSSTHEPVGEHPTDGSTPEELAQHEWDRNAEQTAFREHADRTQTALEALYAAQGDAAGGLRGAEKQHAQAARAVQREADIDPEDLVNSRAIAGHADHEQRARDAAESSLNYESARREDMTGGMGFEDAHGALADETRQTARAVKELSKITGRAPNLAKPTKKSS